jgi:small-conductance mechanosensitive channel
VVSQSPIESVPLDAWTLFNAVLTLVGAYLLVRVVQFGLSALAERSSARRVSIKLFIPILSFLVYAAAVYVVLGPLLQLSATQLLAVSGLVGAALGFGLKDLFAGVIGGLLLVTERTYRVGDKVALGEHYGEVTGIGLRATTLQTADDNEITVPNAALFTDPVSNANDGAPEMMVVVSVSVAPGADIARAKTVVREALITSRYVAVDDDHPVAIRVGDETYHRTIRGKAYVADLRDEFAFETDVTERVLERFAEEDIETPELRPSAPEDGGP